MYEALGLALGSAGWPATLGPHALRGPAPAQGSGTAGLSFQNAPGGSDRPSSPVSSVTTPVDRAVLPVDGTPTSELLPGGWCTSQVQDPHTGRC